MTQAYGVGEPGGPPPGEVTFGEPVRPRTGAVG
jgi:hypothetical protein